MGTNRKLVKFVALFAFLSIFGGVFLAFAPTPAKVASGTSEELRAEVKRFWDCRLAKDHRTIYDIYEPRLKELATLDHFLGAKGLIDYFSYDIEEITVDGDVGRANVRYTWKPNHPAFSSMKVKDDVMEDEWLFVDGKWHKKFVIPSPTQDVNPAAGDPSSIRLVDKNSEPAQN
jgi:hypothetical protein